MNFLVYPIGIDVVSRTDKDQSLPFFFIFFLFFLNRRRVGLDQKQSFYTKREIITCIQTELKQKHQKQRQIFINKISLHCSFSLQVQKRKSQFYIHVLNHARTSPTPS